MSHHNSVEEKQFIKFLEKTPLEDGERGSLVERIQTSGMTEEIIETVRTSLTAAAEKLEPARLNQLNVEMARIIQHWRLSNQLNNARRRR